MSLLRLTKDYARFLSRRATRRVPLAVAELQPLLKAPGMISLSGGLPNASHFPIKNMQFTLGDSHTVQLSGPSLMTALQYSPSVSDDVI